MGNEVSKETLGEILGILRRVTEPAREEIEGIPVNGAELFEGTGA